MKDINNIWEKLRGFISARKGYCLAAVILMVFLAVFLSRVNIETVSQHNRRESAASQERQSILAQMEETGEQNTETQRKTSLPEENGSKDTESSSGGEIIGTSQEMEEGEPEGEAFSRDTQSETESSHAVQSTGTVQPQNNTGEENRQTSVYQQSTGGQTSGQQPSDDQQPTRPASEEQPSVTQPATEKPSQSEYITVAIKISCEKVIDNPDLNTTANIPSGGIFLDTKTVVKRGQTVFDALKAACTDNEIACVYNGSSYGAYISSIAGLSEKECGRYSGWKYKVNSVVPGVACSDYELSEGDEILWYYVASYTD